MTGRAPGRVLILGLDGATWDLLGKLAQDGTMPNLAALMKTSRWGRMASTIPPVTAPAWASMASGMTPGNTGIFDFEAPGESIDRFRPITSANLSFATFPEILEDAGRRVVLINFPTISYPPRTRGPVLGDVLSPVGHSVFPESLADQEPFKRYRTVPDASLIAQFDRYVEDIRDLERVRFECAQSLFGSKWDLFFVMFSATDWIQHQAYSDVLAGKEPRSKAARRIYADLDGYLGWFLSNVGAEDSLMMVSDHGFRSYAGTFSINRWLVSHRYLTERFTSDQLSMGVGKRRFYVPAFILNSVARNGTVWSFAAWIANKLGGRSMSFEGKISPDPAKTVAYSRDYTWGVYLNAKSRFANGLLTEMEADSAARKMVAELQEAVAAKMIEGAKLGKEVYSGGRAATAPEVVLFPSNYAFSGLSKGLISRFTHNGHSIHGIYLLRHPSAAPGMSGDIDIADVFPTVLSLFGVSVPSRADGRSLVDEAGPRSAESGTATRRESVLTNEEEQQIEGRLRDLGYV
ncbi:MAG TPA: alkaline phosphatase family protein [Nitrososphaerales archaeon]|nr:alkaline phosphatase family protein [Nitrososphaerales archaeon]